MHHVLCTLHIMQDVGATPPSLHELRHHEPDVVVYSIYIYIVYIYSTSVLVYTSIYI